MVRILPMASSIRPSLSSFRSAAAAGPPSRFAAPFASFSHNSCRPFSLLHLGSAFALGGVDKNRCRKHDSCSARGQAKEVYERIPVPRLAKNSKTNNCSYFVMFCL